MGWEERGEEEEGGRDGMRKRWNEEGMGERRGFGREN
jgi:hypothetical protein